MLDGLRHRRLHFVGHRGHELRPGRIALGEADADRNRNVRMRDAVAAGGIDLDLRILRSSASASGESNAAASIRPLITSSTRVPPPGAWTTLLILPFGYFLTNSCSVPVPVNVPVVTSGLLRSSSDLTLVLRFQHDVAGAALGVVGEVDHRHALGRGEQRRQR